MPGPRNAYGDDRDATAPSGNLCVIADASGVANISRGDDNGAECTNSGSRSL
jgi:hypothetical protein